MKVVIHGITKYSYANGPGKRCVIHFQGCSLGCSDCFNPNTHQADGGQLLEVEELLKRIPDDVDGVTISGGEPFQQIKPLYALLGHLRKMTDSIVVFSGYYRKEIEQLPDGVECLQLIDVLIDGRYMAKQRETSQLSGSANQTIHFLSSRHTVIDFASRYFELRFDEEGNVVVTGFPNRQIIEEVRDALT